MLVKARRMRKIFKKHYVIASHRRNFLKHSILSAEFNFFGSQPAGKVSPTSILVPPPALSGPSAISSSRPYRTITVAGDLLPPLPNCEGRCRSPAAASELWRPWRNSLYLSQKIRITIRGKNTSTLAKNLSSLSAENLRWRQPKTWVIVRVKFTYRSRKTRTPVRGMFVFLLAQNSGHRLQ